MKNFVLLSVMILLLAAPARVLADTEMLWEKKLPFATATIKYQINGMEEGTEILYIRDSGRERATYRQTVANVMGMRMTNSTITLKTQEFIYSYDLEKGQGFKGVNPQRYMIEEFNKLSPDEQAMVRENARKMGAAYTEGMGGTLRQNAVEILGYPCDKVELMEGSATYLIHETDIALKTEMNMAGMKLTMVAESVDKGRIDDRFFQHPAGIVAEENSESDEMAKGMAVQAIAMLKDPASGKNELMMVPKGLAEGKGEFSAEDQEEMLRQVENVMQGLQGKNTQ